MVFCVDLLLFLGTLHWPSGSDDFGHLGVSFSELLILFEQWAGHRLLSEKVTRPHVRANRPILIPSVPVSEGLRFDMVVSFPVAWFELWPGCLVVFVGSCPVILGGISVLMGLRQDHWNLVIISALRPHVGFWCVPQDQLLSFWMAL